MPSQRYVFPIFKNGSSGLRMWASQNRAKILFNEQITKLSCVDVILRDPDSRLLSGINSFIQFTLRDHPDLDHKTVTWFATNYFWLDRHYSSQFSWLLVLARYMDPQCRMRLLPMTSLQDITRDYVLEDVIDPSDELTNLVKSLTITQMHQRLDWALHGMIGQSITWKELLQNLIQKDSDAYKHIVDHAKKILQPLNVLP